MREVTKPTSLQGVVLLLVCSLCASCSSVKPSVGSGQSLVQAKQTDKSTPEGRPQQFSHVQLLSRKDWVVADFKSVWKTDDAGKTWKRTLSADDEKLPGDSSGGLTFIDSQTGFAIFNYTFKTVDGGDTWRRLGDQRIGAHNIFFSDATNGWAAGSKSADSTGDANQPLFTGGLWRTRDGGRNWKSVQLPKLHMDTSARWVFRDICFSDDSNGWAVGMGVFLHSSDGGETWDELKIHDDLIGIVFANRSVGWAVWRESGEFRLTTDGGKTWKHNDKIVQNVNGQVLFVNEKVGFALKNSIYLVSTTNGGETWELVKIENDPVAELQTATDLSVYLGRAKDGMLVAIWLTGKPKGLISVVSTDNGKTWSRNP